MRSVLILMLVFASSALVADDAVLAAQQKLKKLGYYDGTADGEYGSQTAAAIRRYQLAQNLPVTGNLTAQTRQKLGLPEKSVAPAATPAVPQYRAIADIFKGGPFLTAPTDVQLATVRQAKKNLKTLGFFAGAVNSTVDGALVAALKAWQKDAGFRATGRFDESTLKGLSLMPN
jgi:peptidoglycan hydrolase-like protein with peptidoglycan-binding domain